jgi:predicted ATPase
MLLQERRAPPPGTRKLAAKALARTEGPHGELDGSPWDQQFTMASRSEGVEAAVDSMAFVRLNLRPNAGRSNMLKRIHVRGFKSLFDVNVGLAPLVVLLGPNAAGKSNFLEALFLLSRLVTEKTLAEAFEPLRGYPAEAFSLPELGLPGLLSQDRADLSLQVDLDFPQPVKIAGLRYRIGVEIEPQTGTVEVTDEYLARLLRDGSLKKMDARIEAVGDHLVVRRLSEAGKPRQEPLGLNHALASNLQFSGETRYPDFDLLRAELGRWHTYYLDPRVAMREPQPPREVTDIGPRGQWIAPFLHRLKESETGRRHFDAIRRALRSVIPSIEGLDVDLDKKRGTLDIQISQDGTPYSSRVISEGTLRVLALCAIAANPTPSSLVAFEEPENGVHPRRIEVVADLLAALARRGDTQVVVTTHSPTLIGAMLRKSQEEEEPIRLLRCTQEGRETRLTPFETAGPVFDEQAIRQALLGADDDALVDDALVEALLLRGWVDG